MEASVIWACMTCRKLLYSAMVDLKRGTARRPKRPQKRYMVCSMLFKVCGIESIVCSM